METPGQKPLVVNGVVVGSFVVEEEGTSIASDVVQVEDEHPATPRLSTVSFSTLSFSTLSFSTLSFFTLSVSILSFFPFSFSTLSLSTLSFSKV